MDGNENFIHVRDRRFDIVVSYLFSRVATIAVLWLLQPKQIKELFDSSNLYLTISVLLAFGVYAQVMTRFICELFFYRVQHRLHWFFRDDKSAYGFFNDMGVRHQRRIAYTEARRILREQGEGTEDVRRGELHMLYVATTLLILASAYAWKFKDSQVALGWSSIAILTFTVAIYADSLQHEHEVRQFSRREFKDKIRSQLCSIGLIGEE